MNVKSLILVVSASFCACSALESMDTMERNTVSMRKDTRSLANKFGDTQGQIGETNRKMDETNRQMGETNSKMDEMNSSLGQTNKNLDETNRKMGDMADKLGSMSDSMDKMYGDLRQGDTMQARAKSIEMLEKTPGLGAKVTHAAHYLLSFEYQLWKGDGNDTETRRFGLINDAVRELSTDIQRYLDESRKINPASNDEKLLNLFAIASCLEMNNPSTEATLRARGIEPVSMYDLIKNALHMGAELKAGTLQIENLPAYAASVLEYEADFVYLLQLRGNMLPGLVVGALSDADSDLFLGLKAAWTQANLFLHSWKAQTDKRNLVQLRLYSRWLKDAASLKEFMKSVGVEARIDPLLFRVLRNMRIPELNGAEGLSFSTTMEPARKAELTSLSESLASFLGGG